MSIQNTYSLLNKSFQYEIIGIPNHSYEKNILLNQKSKIQKTIKNNLNLSEEIKFLTLISRPEDNNWCNSIDRNNYLRTIGNFDNLV